MDCDLFELWRKQDGPGVFFTVSGPISQQLLVEICNNVGRKMKNDRTAMNTMMKVQAVIVELAQNISRYSAEKMVDRHGGVGAGELGSGVISIALGHESFRVTSGNLINNVDIERMDRMMKQLQTMNKGELRSRFLSQRKRPDNTGSRGAGLGLIEVCRKASAPIEYEFRKVDGKSSFFCVEIRI